MSEVTASAGAERAAGGGAELSADQAHSLYRDGFVRVASQPPPPALALTPAVVLAGRPQGPHPEGDLERRAAAADDAARRRAAGRLRLQPGARGEPGRRRAGGGGGGAEGHGQPPRGDRALRADPPHTGARARQPAGARGGGADGAEFPDGGGRGHQRDGLEGCRDAVLRLGRARRRCLERWHADPAEPRSDGRGEVV